MKKKTFFKKEKTNKNIYKSGKQIAKSKKVPSMLLIKSNIKK